MIGGEPLGLVFSKHSGLLHATVATTVMDSQCSDGSQCSNGLTAAQP